LKDSATVIEGRLENQAKRIEQLAGNVQMEHLSLAPSKMSVEEVFQKRNDVIKEVNRPVAHIVRCDGVLLRNPFSPHITSRHVGDRSVDWVHRLSLHFDHFTKFLEFNMRESIQRKREAFFKNHQLLLKILDRKPQLRASLCCRHMGIDDFRMKPHFIQIPGQREHHTIPISTMGKGNTRKLCIPCRCTHELEMIRLIQKLQKYRKCNESLTHRLRSVTLSSRTRGEKM
jgi:hypothetical protein